MNSLYPLKFKPIYKEKIWGGDKIKTILGKDFSPLANCGESWEISSIEGDLSVVQNGFLEDNNLQELIEVYLGDLVGDKVYEKFGEEFPLLIKFIDAQENLSVQVHPDDKTAIERHGCYGKTEMWYVLHANKNSEIISGFNKATTKEELEESLNKKNLTSILNSEKAQTGDVFFMPAGRIHAIGAGVCLAEIQQTSDVTYRVYDWDRVDYEGTPRELHLDDALDVIDYSFHKDYKTSYKLKVNIPTNVVTCPYFTTNIINIDTPVNIDYHDLDSFVIYICVEGVVNIQYRNEFIEIKKGETILIPAELKNLKLFPEVESKILEVYIK